MTDWMFWVLLVVCLPGAFYAGWRFASWIIKRFDLE